MFEHRTGASRPTGEIVARNSVCNTRIFQYA